MPRFQEEHVASLDDAEKQQETKRPRVSQGLVCKPSDAATPSLACMFELPIEEFQKLRMIHFRAKREQIEAPLAEYRAFATKALAAVHTVRDQVANKQKFLIMSHLGNLHNSSVLKNHFPMLGAVIPERYPYSDKIDRAWLRDHLNDADVAIKEDMKELETHIKNDLEKLAQLEGA